MSASLVFQTSGYVVLYKIKNNLKIYFVIIVEFFKFYHGLKNHYNLDDVNIFVALLEIQKTQFKT